MDPEPLRLLRAYRGYRRGEVISATPSLAKVLVESGVAQRVEEEQRLPGMERAVESVKVETR